MSEIYYNASNLIVSNGFVRNPERYYLEEFFLQRPAFNSILNTQFADANATASTNTDIRIAEKIANKNFEILGSNVSASTTSCTFNDTARAAITITTQSSDQDQAIIAPHLDQNQTAWTAIKWGTRHQLEWECAISIPNIDDIKVWAGLKLTNDQLFEADADQAYFKFQTDSDNSGTFTTLTNLHFIYSIEGRDYITDLEIKVVQNTIYRLRIVINKARQVNVFVNEKHYSLTQTPGGSGTTETAVNKSSLAMKDNVYLIPYIGVETGASNAKSLDVFYQKISRALFE